MLNLNKSLIRLDVDAKNAEEAIRAAGALLVNANKVEERYIDSMVQGYKEIGPYIVLAPQVAIPHARPEHGVLEQGVSLVRLNRPVIFGHPTNDPVRLVCAICGTDNTSHIGALQSLAAVLGNKEKLSAILGAKDEEEILSIFN